MGLTIGVLASEHIVAGVVEGDKLVGPLQHAAEEENRHEYFWDLHVEEFEQRIYQLIVQLQLEKAVEAVGVGFPGIIRDGIVEEAPNLPQMKGEHLATSLQTRLSQVGLNLKVHILNDADAIAAGVAATRGHLDKLVRVWFLGKGIGYGRYPQAVGAGEGGHTVVSLDAKENFCQCGGIGHLEGIMGFRSMRLRFLDLEPEEVFDLAKSGDGRCRTFVELWHRALAAATATSIHLNGPGKFFISGPNAKFVNPEAVQIYLQEMVKMSPLQGSALEVISMSDEIAVVGAAVSAARAADFHP